MNEQIVSKILTEIDDLEDDIIDLTKKMIRIPSVNPPGKYEEISYFLSEFLSGQGFKTEIIEVPAEMLRSKGLESPRPNLIATYSTGRPGPTFIMNGHLDVVPPGPNWTVDPFQGIVKEGKIFGRGASDMKGTLTSMMMSVIALKDLEIPLKGDVKLVFCVDEETGGWAGARYIVEEVGIKGDYCISEGTIDSIERAWNGAWWFNLTTHGKSAHGSVPWLGVNAIEKMCKFVSGLADLQHELEKKESSIPGIRWGTVNVGSIRGGKEVNTVPSSCKLSVSRRIIPGETIGSAKDEINELLKRLMDEDPELEFELETFFQTEPRELAENHPFINRVSKVAKIVTAQELALKGSTGFIDGRFFMKHDIPTIGLGVSEEDVRMHGPDEFVRISSLLKATKIYSLAIGEHLEM